MLNWWQRIAAFFVACLAFQLLLAGWAAAEPYTAEEMLSECQALLASAKSTSDPDAVELENTFSTGACWGAFLSLQQLVTLKVDGSRSTLLQICVPEDVTLVRLIQVFDGYGKAHPGRESEPFTVVALSALRDAFRCGGERGRER